MTQDEKLELYHLRGELGITLKELSDRCKLSPSSLSGIEKHKSVPRVVNAYAILRALNQFRSEKGLSELAYQDIAW